MHPILYIDWPSTSTPIARSQSELSTLHYICTCLTWDRVSIYPCEIDSFHYGARLLLHCERLAETSPVPLDKDTPPVYLVPFMTSCHFDFTAYALTFHICPLRKNNSPTCHISTLFSIYRISMQVICKWFLGPPGESPTNHKQSSYICSILLC